MPIFSNGAALKRTSNEKKKISFLATTLLHNYFIVLSHPFVATLCVAWQYASSKSFKLKLFETFFFEKTTNR